MNFIQLFPVSKSFCLDFHRKGNTYEDWDNQRFTIHTDKFPISVRSGFFFLFGKQNSNGYFLFQGWGLWYVLKAKGTTQSIYSQLPNGNDYTDYVVCLWYVDDAYREYLQFRMTRRFWIIKTTPVVWSLEYFLNPNLNCMNRRSDRRTKWVLLL